MASALADQGVFRCLIWKPMLLLATHGANVERAAGLALHGGDRFLAGQ